MSERRSSQCARKATIRTTGFRGFAFDFAGNLFFGMGENLGEPYRTDR